MTGRTSGTTTSKKIRYSLNPSMRALSLISRGHRAQELREDEDRDGQPLRGVDEDQRGQRVGEPEVHDQLEKRDGAEPDRHHDAEDQVQPEKRVCRGSGTRSARARPWRRAAGSAPATRTSRSGCCRRTAESRCWSARSRSPGPRTPRPRAAPAARGRSPCRLLRLFTTISTSGNSASSEHPGDQHRVHRARRQPFAQDHAPPPHRSGRARISPRSAAAGAARRRDTPRRRRG